MKNQNKSKPPSAWVTGPVMSRPETTMDRDALRFELLVLDAKACHREDAVSFMRYFRQIHSLWIKWTSRLDFGLTRVEEMNELRNIAARHKVEMSRDFWSEIDELEEHLFTRCSHDHRLRGKRDHHVIRLLVDRLWAMRAQYRDLFSTTLCKPQVISLYMDQCYDLFEVKQPMVDELAAA